MSKDIRTVKMGGPDAPYRKKKKEAVLESMIKKADERRAAAKEAIVNEKPVDKPGTVTNPMNFHTRKWVKPEDLNPNGSLFGGKLLAWIDEEAAIYAMIQLQNQNIVTKLMSEINFVSSAKQGEIIEMGIVATHFGNTSLTMRCEVRNKMTKQTILSIDKIVFVNMGEDGKPAPHGKTEITYAYR